MDPESIRKTLAPVVQLSDIQALNNSDLKRSMNKLLDCSGALGAGKTTGSEAEALVKALIDSNPMLGMKRGIEMHQKVMKELENESDAGWVWRFLVGVVANTMVTPGDLGKSVCEHFLAGGGVALCLKELSSPDFLKHKNDDPRNSLAAKVLGIYISLLFNVSYRGFTGELGTQLRSNGFFKVLEPYSSSEYDIYFHIPAPSEDQFPSLILKNCCSLSKQKGREEKFRSI